MADSLFFRFAGQDIEWLTFSDRGQLLKHVVSDPGAFREETEAFAGRSVLVVPGESVLLTTARVPSRQQRQIVQAVPYVVEEQLACDVEDCFFALGDRNSDGDIRVAVVERSLMESWVKQVEELDLRVTSFVAENELVACSTGAYALADGDRLHLGWREGRGITSRIQDLPLLVSLIEAPESIEVEAQAEEVELQVSELEASGLEVILKEPSESPFLSLCMGYSGRTINLRQGPYKLEERREGSTTQVWKSVAVLCGVALLLHVLLQFGQGWYLESRASDIGDETLALYQEIFPSDRNVRDIKRRWNAHLGNQAAGGSDFLGVFGRAARGLPDAGLVLDNVNFNESRGDLILQVTGNRSEALVQYAQKLTQEGLAAEIGTINQEEGSVRGSIKVRVSGRAS